MVKKKDKKLLMTVLIVLGVIGGIIFLGSFIFTGFFGICTPFEPVSGTSQAILDNIELRFGRISSADFEAEVSGLTDCQTEIIENVKADAVGIVNNVQVYFQDAELKYYWCDADNKVILSSSKVSDVENYFNSLYTCVSDELTTLFQQ